MVIQKVSLCPSIATGNISAVPEQGRQPVSPTQIAHRQQDSCTGFAESSATRPVQKSSWSSEQAGGALLVLSHVGQTLGCSR